MSADSSVSELQNGTQTGSNATHTGTDEPKNGTQASTNRTEAATNGTQTGTNGTQAATNGTQTGTNGTQATTNGTQTRTNGTQTETNSTESDKTNQTAGRGAHEPPSPQLSPLLSIFFVNDLQYDIFPVHPENGSFCTTDQGKFSCLFIRLLFQGPVVCSQIFHGFSQFVQ